MRSASTLGGGSGELRRHPGAPRPRFGESVGGGQFNVPAISGSGWSRSRPGPISLRVCSVESRRRLPSKSFVMIRYFRLAGRVPGQPSRPNLRGLILSNRWNEGRRRGWLMGWRSATAMAIERTTRGPIGTPIVCLWNGIAERFYKMAYRMMGNAHDADDIVQESFLRGVSEN